MEAGGPMLITAIEGVGIKAEEVGGVDTGSVANSSTNSATSDVDSVIGADPVPVVINNSETCEVLD